MGSIANELITRGWNKGTWDAQDGSVCIEGAACHALYGKSWFDLMDNEAFGAEGRIQEVLAPVIGGYKHPFMWNDAPERTYDEVLLAAKHADELLDSGRGL